MEGGDMLLTRTLIKDNTAVRLDFTQASGAAALGANGANILRTGGSLIYEAPTPPGHWLLNARCIAKREPCPSSAQDLYGDRDPSSPSEMCKRMRSLCEVTAGSAENNWMPTVSVEVPNVNGYIRRLSHRTTAFTCTPPTTFQGCQWQTSACTHKNDSCLLGRTVYEVPFVVDVGFPESCASGYLGSDEVAYQGNSDCKGKCEAGTYCPEKATIEPIVCPPGHYCAQGSTAPTPFARCEIEQACCWHSTHPCHSDECLMQSLPRQVPCRDLGKWHRPHIGGPVLGGRHRLLGTHWVSRKNPVPCVRLLLPW